MLRRNFLRALAVAAVPNCGAASIAQEQGRAKPEEEIPLEPKRAIVDSHHHLWDVKPTPGYSFRRFLLPEMLDVVRTSGHNITQTVFAECRQMYRADGPNELRVVGETEFVNGIAAMSASGFYGPQRIAAGIIATADLRLGEKVRPVLEAQIAAGNGRLRGIRMTTAYDPASIFGWAPDPSLQGVLLDLTLRRGAKQLQRLGLRWDIWCLHPQLSDVADVAGALPDTTIVLDHLGTPLNIGRYAGRQEEVFADWRKRMLELARRPNVVVKLGGLGMDLAAPIGSVQRQQSSTTLAPLWRPYIETCIEAFKPERCMFESNFPPDNASCSYGAIWNTFKRIVASYSEAEKGLLFCETATRIYGLPVSA